MEIILSWRRNVKIAINSKTIISGAPASLEGEIRQRLTFANPAYEEAERRGRWVGNIEPLVRCYQQAPEGLAVPRGWTRQLINMTRRHGVAYTIEDERRFLPSVDFRFSGKLRPYQQEALEAILQRDFGVVTMPTGAGKTTLALALVAARKQPATVIVHTAELQHQWHERIHQFLGIPMDEIGMIGGGRFDMAPRISVGIVNSIYPRARDVAEKTGLLIVDEVHRCPARIFQEAVQAFDSKYVLGLSATAYRRDGLGRLIWWSIGEKIFEIDRERLTRAGHLVPLEAEQRPTSFKTCRDASAEYQAVLSELVEDPARNQQIAADTADAAKDAAGTVLVLTDRVSHADTLQRMIREQGIQCEVLTGRLSQKKRQGIVERLNDGNVPVLIATASLLGEGFDCKGLSVLVMASPVKFSGRIIQSVGRILRPSEGKATARVIDYCDPLVPVLAASARARQRVFGELAA